MVNEMEHHITKIVGCFVGGITFMYSLWYLLNFRRMKMVTKMYRLRSSICLAVGCLCISSVFLFSLLSNLITVTYVFYMRMSVIFSGMIFLTLSMYFNENELFKNSSNE